MKNTAKSISRYIESQCSEDSFFELLLKLNFQIQTSEHDNVPVRLCTIQRLFFYKKNTSCILPSKLILRLCSNTNFLCKVFFSYTHDHLIPSMKLIFKCISEHISFWSVYLTYSLEKGFSQLFLSIGPIFIHPFYYLITSTTPFSRTYLAQEQSLY